MLSYTIPKATVQHVLLKCHQAPEASSNLHVQKVLHRLKICRTAAMGYHVYRCSNDECGEIKYQYHSCRDRHCPGCGAIKKDECLPAGKGRDRSPHAGTASRKVLSCGVYIAP